MQLAPEYDPVHFYMGYALLLVGKPRQAEMELREAVRLNPALRSNADFRAMMQRAVTVNGD